MSQHIPNENPPRIRRRHFLRTAAGWVATGLTPHAWAGAAAEQHHVISVFHTTDLHGHIDPTDDYAGRPNLGGLARCATQIRRWRREAPDHLLLDIGDVYQGTHAGLATQGDLMIRCLNALHYDAWIAGNHDFDWGMDIFQKRVTQSSMPVLMANAAFHERWTGAIHPHAPHPLARVRPFLVKRFGDIRVAVIGLTSPGLPHWLPPACLGAMQILDPATSLARTLKLLEHDPPHVLIVAGHMGLRDHGDDFANRVQETLKLSPQVDLYLAAHTHQHRPKDMVNGVLCTQAGYFGIHCGRVDLRVDRRSHRLVSVTSHTALMDAAIPPDSAILKLTETQRAASQSALAETIATLPEPLGITAPFGHPTAVEQLWAEAIAWALRPLHLEPDVVVHGQFYLRAPVPQGPLTLEDVWRIAPFENSIVTARVSGHDLRLIVEEVTFSKERRGCVGLRFERASQAKTIKRLALSHGIRIDPARRYRLALNSYDAQSGGQRFVRLRSILERSSSALTYHPLGTREALVAWLRHRYPVETPTSPPTRGDAASSS